MSVHTYRQAFPIPPHTLGDICAMKKARKRKVIRKERKEMKKQRNEGINKKERKGNKEEGRIKGNREEGKEGQKYEKN